MSSFVSLNSSNPARILTSHSICIWSHGLAVWSKQTSSDETEIHWWFSGPFQQKLPVGLIPCENADKEEQIYLLFLSLSFLAFSNTTFVLLAWVKHQRLADIPSLALNNTVGILLFWIPEHTDVQLALFCFTHHLSSPYSILLKYLGLKWHFLLANISFGSSTARISTFTYSAIIDWCHSWSLKTCAYYFYTGW